MKDLDVGGGGGGGALYFIAEYYSCITQLIYKPANAAMHGPHSLVRFGPGCAGRAYLHQLVIRSALVRFGNYACFGPFR